MIRVVVIGGGWAGVAAATAARKAGAKVTLLERMDILLGLGNVGGIMRNNGRYTGTEECILLGAKELFHITDKLSRHVNIDFPGHKHASLYDVCKIEPMVRRFLEEIDIELMLQSRAMDVKMDGQNVLGIILQDGRIIEGDVFIETTGSTGPMGNCLSMGMVVVCVSFSAVLRPRVSISQKAGVEDILGQRKDGSMEFSGSCKSTKIFKPRNYKGIK